MNTNICARFLVDHTVDLVSFQDPGGDLFQLFPASQHLDNLQFYLTDVHGRGLGDLLPPPAAFAPLPFHLTLRWDAVVPDPLPPKPPVPGPFTGNYKNAITPLN